MLFNNPAVNLYRYWREVIRYHAEFRVDQMRAGLDASRYRTANEIEETTIKQASKQSAHTKLNYRVGLAVTGLSLRHAGIEIHGGQPVRVEHLPQDLAKFEPVITLMHYNSYRGNAIFTLFPDGTFFTDNLPAYYHHILCNWTFLRNAHVAGRRVWALPVGDKEIQQQTATYAHVNERDFAEQRLYLPLHSLNTEQEYQLVLDEQERLRFRAVSVNAFLATRALDEGYAACFARYERYRRKSERGAPPPPPTVTPEQISDITQHLRVYPAPRPPKEAHDGRHNMESSPVPQ